MSSSSLDLSTSKVVFNWNDTMIDYALTNTELVVDMYGPNEPYSVTWISTFNDNLLTIEFQ